MSKTSDSYDSLIRGVSQQSAHDRLPGQHWEQDNLISDPVRGLARRHGSVWLDEVPLDVELVADVQADLSGRMEDTLFIKGVEYAVFRRDGTVPASAAPPLIMVNKDTRKLFPIVLSEGAERIARDGISSVCTAGQYILMSGAKELTQYKTVDNVKPTSNSHVLWVRGGAYSRTFTIMSTDKDGEQVSVSYTTMKSYYDKPLDTSDIPHLDPADPTKPNPDYNKLVNDRSNAYNSAVNKHIADAAKDITPENIAKKLAEKLKALYPGVRADGPYILVRASGITLSADDGGNGEFIRAASRDVTSPELLTEKHYPGKVMIVQPKAAGTTPYYMVAESSTGATGFTEVIWRETAGVVVKPGFMFLIGLIHQGQLVMAATANKLKEMTGVEVPQFETSRCGDLESRQVPELFGRAITYMRMFQDRLLMMAGATAFMSKTGDYFNWFGDSILVVKADDPIEVFAQGTEDDTVTAGVQMDRNVILFGKRFQYMLSGREVMTPNNAYIAAVASYEGANLTQPATGGSLLFFCQRRERRLTMQQMQPGMVADRLDAFDVSAQLDGYLTGTPKQIIAQTSPSAVFIKTKELTNGFYVYSFLDSNDQAQRLFDSWSRWTFDKRLGVLAGITSDDSGILAVTCRATSTGTKIVLDRFSRETELSDLPYLDSMRRGYNSTLLHDGAYAAFDNTTKRHLLGTTLEKADDLAKRFPSSTTAMWSGTMFDSLVTLTSPYLRDDKDRVILDAKLTISKLTTSLAHSAAMIAEISTDGGKTYKPSANWIARPTGGWVLNEQRIEDQKTLPVPVMKDNKTYRARFRSNGWMPLTISVIEWAGQAFTSRR